MRKWLEGNIKKEVGDLNFDVLIPPDPAMGDYSTNVAFALAKHENKNPMEVAEQLSHGLADPDVFEKVEIAKPGYVNFFLKPEFLQSELKRIHEHREHYGKQGLGDGKTVIVEYSSPNIAKPMHVGHLRTTIIGDALANVYEALGYRVIRWNYIGDWGTQFGKLIVAIRKWGDGSIFDKSDPVNELVNLYVKFHEELKQDANLDSQAQKEFQKLEEGDEENRALWSKIRQVSLEDLNRAYRQIGTHFDLFKGESDYESELKPIIEWLQKEGKIKESEGALIFDLEKYNLPPGLLRKSDGATLYLTRDLASLGDRLKTYAPAKILYVVANQQALHLEQLFAIAKELNMDSAKLAHVKFGMVLGEDGKKLATREGKVVLLQEVIDKIVGLAADVVRQKNSELSDDEVKKISQAVGIGALKYNDLKQHPHTDIVFNWKQMLDLSGNSGPYLQYTYARLMSILAKAEGGSKAENLNKLSHPIEMRLMKRILDFPDAVEKCTENNALTGLALYLYELASLASRYYEEVRILDATESKDEEVLSTAVRNARLVLIETVSSVLKKGLNLLGIQTLERI